MTSRESRAQLLARIVAKMKYTPDLFDVACKRVADNVDELDNATLALLAGPKRLTPEQTDLLLKIFPPERPAPKGDGSTEP